MTVLGVSGFHGLPAPVCGGVRCLRVTASGCAVWRPDFVSAHAGRLDVLRPILIHRLFVPRPFEVSLPEATPRLLGNPPFMYRSQPWAEPVDPRSRHERALQIRRPHIALSLSIYIYTYVYLSLIHNIYIYIYIYITTPEATSALVASIKAQSSAQASAPPLVKTVAAGRVGRGDDTV